MNVSDFDYDLPEELIAQVPAPERRASRMLVMSRTTGDCEVRKFAEFAEYLHPTDCLVLNDTRVIMARIFGTKVPTGGAVEALLTTPVRDGVWQAMLKPGRRLPLGSRVAITGSDAEFEVTGRNPAGTFEITFSTTAVFELLQRCGHMPLPPYIRRSDDAADATRYQTVYNAAPGAVAAPTAGLHFDEEMLKQIEAMGVAIIRLTLHVGVGTFQPVAVERLEDHVMHTEQYRLGTEAAACINQRRTAGGRVIAVGTTSVRVLETCTTDDGGTQPATGTTGIFLYPPYKPRSVDVLLTNFHLPRSTLLMLVSTFARREHVLAAYQRAIAERMKFYSYGDCMLLV
jgi:S-adenosylmethionine:tRNA ribosyltransferase-isomerase